LVRGGKLKDFDWDEFYAWVLIVIGIITLILGIVIVY
jgi:hypothetical protein